MTPKELISTLKQLHEAATRAPWKAAPSSEAGENWAIAFSTGQTDDNQHWHVCTDHVRASELRAGTAKTDAEAIAGIRNELPRIIRLLEAGEEVAKVLRLHARYNKWPNAALSAYEEAGK